MAKSIYYFLVQNYFLDCSIGHTVVKTEFVGFCQNKIQGHSRTFQGLNFRIQGLFEWAQMNLLTCTLNVLINIVASAVDVCG